MKAHSLLHCIIYLKVFENSKKILLLNLNKTKRLLMKDPIAKNWPNIQLSGGKVPVSDIYGKPGSTWLKKTATKYVEINAIGNNKISVKIIKSNLL